MNKESKKKNNSNTLLVIGLLLLFVVIGVGYAALSSVLQINGTANIGRSSWNVHFENVQVTQGSGDQGVDILAEKDEIRYAIQCKSYKGELSNKPIQEVYAGLFQRHFSRESAFSGRLILGKVTRAQGCHGSNKHDQRTAEGFK